eukprot:988984-Amphidinium_carterae.1
MLVDTDMDVVVFCEPGGVRAAFRKLCKSLGPGYAFPLWRDSNQVQLSHCLPFMEPPQGLVDRWNHAVSSVVMSIDVCFVERLADGRVRVPGFGENDCALHASNEFSYIRELTL